MALVTKLFTWMAAIVGLALLPLLTDNLFWINALVFAGLYTMVGCGLTLLFGYADQLSLGHGAFFGIGAYVTAIGALTYGLPVWMSILLAVGGSLLMGLLLSWPLLRLRGLALAMTTLAFALIAYTVFTQLSITNGAVGLPGIPPLEVGPVTFDTPDRIYWLVLALTVGVFLFSRGVAKSRVGRALRAIGISEDAAASVGVSTTGYKIRVFTFSAGLAGLAGGLYATYLTFISSTSFSIDLSFVLILVIAIGGYQQLWGAVLGGFFMASVPDLLSRWSVHYSVLLYGVVLTVIFMFARGGLVGLVRWVSNALTLQVARLRPKRGT